MMMTEEMKRGRQRHRQKISQICSNDHKTVGFPVIRIPIPAVTFINSFVAVVRPEVMVQLRLGFVRRYQLTAAWRIVMPAELWDMRPPTQSGTLMQIMHCVLSEKVVRNLLVNTKVQLTHYANTVVFCDYYSVSLVCCVLYTVQLFVFLSASLYFSKRGAY